MEEVRKKTKRQRKKKDDKEGNQEGREKKQEEEEKEDDDEEETKEERTKRRHTRWRTDKIGSLKPLMHHAGADNSALSAVDAAAQVLSQPVTTVSFPLSEGPACISACMHWTLLPCRGVRDWHVWSHSVKTYGL